MKDDVDVREPLYSLTEMKMLSGLASLFFRQVANPISSSTFPNPFPIPSGGSSLPCTALTCTRSSCVMLMALVVT